MKKWMWFVLSAVVIVADQISKYVVTIKLEPYQPYDIMPMLNFTLAYNTGAAFSFLSSAGDWHHLFFMLFSALVSLGLIVWIIRLPKQTQTLQFMALSLILGGAVANLIDRVTLGYVIDFIDVYYKNHHWPIFNIADSAITLGTMMLAYDLCFHSTPDVCNRSNLNG